MIEWTIVIILAALYDKIVPTLKLCFETYIHTFYTINDRMNVKARGTQYTIILYAKLKSLRRDVLKTWDKTTRLMVALLLVVTSMESLMLIGCDALLPW